MSLTLRSVQAADTEKGQSSRQIGSSEAGGNRCFAFLLRVLAGHDQLLQFLLHCGLR